MISNSDISEILELTGKLMELHNENPFKIRAVSSAAFRVDKLTVDLCQLPETELAQVEGIGKGIAQKIIEIKNTGSTKELQELLEKTPEGILDVMKIKGLGPKKVQKLWEELGIESIGELLYACRENRLLDLKGFGEKTQSGIIEQIQFILSTQDYFHYATCEQYVQLLETEINRQLPGVKYTFTGAYARKCEVLNELSLLTTSTDLANLEPTLQQLIPVKIKIEVTEESTFAGRAFKQTCTPEHWEALTKMVPETSLITMGEAEAYKAASLPCIPAELREEAEVLTIIATKGLPNLITFEELKGSFHNHTQYSDGKNTLKEMAQQCINMGLNYFGVADHSQSAVYAKGLQPERVLQQHKEIEKLNSELAPFRIFKGIESDIKSDGSLDYEDDILKTFDFVVASIHQGFKMSEEQSTARLIKAIENPYTTMLGHMTGRLLLSRKGYPVDHKKVIDAAASNNVIIEINAHPYRLDIDWRWIPYCLEKGVVLSINPDAHEKAGFYDMHYGVHVARKGMLTAENCFNAWSLEKVEDWLKMKRK